LVIAHKPSDETLRYYYRKCKALLWPSIVEGFGLPLLEVMAQGRPFLSLNTGVAQEICVKDSRVLPPNRAIWQEEILKLCKSRYNIDEEQISKATTYSWNSVACKADDSISKLSKK
jgi:glycosyltransferase involved in cell wall biosynthesis